MRLQFALQGRDLQGSRVRLFPEMTWFPAGLGLCKTRIGTIVHLVTQGLLAGGPCDAFLLE